MTTLGLNSAYYLSQNPDVRAAVENGVFTSAAEHFERFGRKEGRDPNRLFDTDAYAAANQDVVAAVANNQIESLYDHYVEFGLGEDRSGTPDFEPQFYARNNQDVVNAVGNDPAALFDHYVQFGRAEGRPGSAPDVTIPPDFDPQFYAANNQDVVNAVGNDPAALLDHYLQFGLAEGRPGSAPDVTVSGSVLVDSQGPVTDIPANASTLDVGDAGDGTVTASGGARFTFTSDNFDNVDVGAGQGNTGTFTLSGRSAQLTTAGANNVVHVGRVGEGTLNVEAGADVQALELLVARDGTGDVNLTGDGTRMTLSTDTGRFTGDFSFEAGFARVAEDPGSRGTLRVEDGALLAIVPGQEQNTDTSGPGINIGEELNSQGDFFVDGRGTLVDISQNTTLTEFGPFIVVGDDLGQGDMFVRNESAVRLSGPGAYFGIGDGDPGSADETTDTSQVQQSTVTIESAGKVDVTGAGNAENDSADVVIGQRPDGDGVLNVRGEGSLLSVSGPISPYVGVGQNGNGILNVEDGGRVETLFLSIGAGASGTGTVSLKGSGSTLIADGVGQAEQNGGFVTVGRDGDGDLTVADGASMMLKSAAGFFPGFNAGRSSGSEGDITVRGQGSLIQVDGQSGGVETGGEPGFIAIARSGNGSLTIESGARVLNDPQGTTFVSSAAVDGSLGNGTITVTGNGSEFDAGDRLIISAGFDFQTATIDFNQSGSGSVSVMNGATLSAGEAGDGENDIFIGSGGSLQVASNATVEGDVRNEGGTFDPGNSPGTAHILGDFVNEGDIVFELTGQGPGMADKIDVSGDAYLDGAVTLDFADAFEVDAGDRFELVDAGGTATQRDGLEVRTQGLDEELSVELVGQNGALVAEVIADPLSVA